MVWNAASSRIFAFALFTIALFHTSAFAEDGSVSATAQSGVANEAVIKELSVAKSADWEAALDPGISPTRRETFLSQMNKADRAIKELSHGFTVSQTDLNDALWIPPKHMTAKDRARLIARLKQAREQDDANEQQMLNDLAWTRSGLPVHTAEFDERKAKIDELIKDLEIGEHIHYSDLKQALDVPPSPY